MKKIVAYFLFSLILLSCNSIEKKKNVKTVEEFYKIYAQRNDAKRLMNFYSDFRPKWVDAVSQSLIEGKNNIQDMYESSWNDKNFKKHQNYPESITIKEIVSNDSIVAVSGQYNPYYYNDKLVPEMKFTSWLYFDRDGKIKKQIEWMQYTMNDLKDIINFKQNAEIN
ncbi:MAG: hypothetical protein J6581_02550 [Apibacter sp.]|jgi:hypothetical protein|uniref:SnoaL-like domain-containing protein n=1 Tax=Apibacter mensalis TaxID=1586267 RepID=A0A0X3ANV0_9FLAO|nr:hypothetical protein [Apibacter mensalis]MCO6564305.1 hypothetical protein [Apibacter sp.]CVK16819.1 hypothetical protein Ga0061079_11111 [Apibacter mensalis]